MKQEIPEHPTTSMQKIVDQLGASSIADARKKLTELQYREEQIGDLLAALDRSYSAIIAACNQYPHWFDDCKNAVRRINEARKNFEDV